MFKKLCGLTLAVIIAATMFSVSADVNFDLYSDAFENYEEVIFEEDFEGDTQIDTASFGYRNRDGSSAAIVSDDRGEYVHLWKENATVDTYFRMLFGGGQAPIASVYPVDKLSKMQISFDVCLNTLNSNASYINFIDKYSDTSAAKIEKLIYFNSNQTISFANDDATVAYELGEWITFDVFFEFADGAGMYSVYVNGVETVLNAALETLTTCVESVGVAKSATGAAENYSVFMDNIRVAIPPVPVVIVPKPYEYNNVLFEEDFNGDTVISSDFGYRNRDGSSAAIESGENGEFVHLWKENATVDTYFRMNFGNTTGPVAEAYKDGENCKLQFTFDICANTFNSSAAYINFIDKLSDTSAAKIEKLIFFNSNGKLSFANSDAIVPYELGEWLTFDVFFEFVDGVGTYSAYVNNNLAVDNANLEFLTSFVESVGIAKGSTGSPESFSIYMDNVKVMSPAKLEVKNSLPQNGANAVNVVDGIEFEFSNPLDENLTEFVNVTAQSGNTADSIYVETETEDNKLRILFDGFMEFNTKYTVTVNGGLTDLFGQTLGQDITIEFNTCDIQVLTSVPVFSDKVEAVFYNPENDSKTAVLNVLVVNDDGTQNLYGDTQTVTNGSAVLEVLFDASTLEEGQKAYAFVSDSETSFNLYRDVVSSTDTVYEGSGKNTNIALNKALLVGDELHVEGKLSADTVKNVIVKVIQNGSVVYVMPLQSDEKGNITHIVSVENFPYGEMEVSLCGYNMNSDEKTIINLTDAEKTPVLDVINNATNVRELETELNKNEVSEKINIDEQLYKANTYYTLIEQRPFASYDDAIEMIYRAEELLKGMNDADWTDYTGIFTSADADIILKGAEKLTKYLSLSATKKNEINRAVAGEGPFESFKELRTVFDAKVKAKTTVIIQTGGGGGGSNDTSTGGVLSYGSGGAPVASPTPVKPEEKLFTDMADVEWAKSSVEKLSQKGIISKAENYRPFDNVTRAEFTKMLVVLSGISVSGMPNFTDVSESDWYAPYLAAAQNAGIVTGSGDGKFNPDSFITRQDMVVMAFRTVEAMNKTLSVKNEAVNFTDKQSISDYAVNAVTAMQKAGIVSGVGNGCFEPMGLANRAQSAVVISNLLDAIM